MKNCLIVNDIEYSFEEVKEHIIDNFDSGHDDWYGKVNEMTFETFTDIVKSLRKNDKEYLKLLWKKEVLDDETDKSFDDWVDEYNG